MKKPNRRSKRTSVAAAGSSSRAKHDGTEEQEYNIRYRDLEIENEAYKREIDELKCKLASLTLVSSVSGTPKVKEDGSRNTFMDSKKKMSSQSQLSTQRKKYGNVGIVSPDDIQRLKAEKVQLLCKMKLQSMQFRISKATLEKEVLQLKKEQRKSAHELRKLLALNQKQKLVLQRKIEEADIATKRLKELLESRKASAIRNSGEKAENRPGFWAAELELKFAARMEEVRSEYERQMEEMAEEVMKYEEEAETLRQENFRCLLENKEVDCTARDSELKSLKEEIFRLNSLLCQIRIPKAPEIHQKKPKVFQDISAVADPTPSASEKSNMGTYESECSRENVSMIWKSGKEVCCSCSKKSLCKTLKCECRVAGGCCSQNCGCTASKCANRKLISVKLYDSLKSEVAQEVAHNLASSGTEGVIPSLPTEVDNNCESKRKPLTNIGNTLVNASPIKRVLKTRGSKLADQLKPLDPSLLPANAEDSTSDGITVNANVRRKSKRAMSAAVPNKNS